MPEADLFHESNPTAFACRLSTPRFLMSVSGISSSSLLDLLDSDFATNRRQTPAQQQAHRPPQAACTRSTRTKWRSRNTPIDCRVFRDRCVAPREALDPLQFMQRTLVHHVSGVQRRSRLKQDHPAFLLSHGTMLHSPRNHN